MAKTILGRSGHRNEKFPFYSAHIQRKYALLSVKGLNHGNFRSLINLLSRHSPEVCHQLENYSSSATWLSPLYQNEIIQFLSSQVHCFIKHELHELHEAKYFTVLADETKDVSKREQLSIAFRYVQAGKTIERFAGYTLASDLTAKCLADYITTKMSELELNTDYLVSQCYDGKEFKSVIGFLKHASKKHCDNSKYYF